VIVSETPVDRGASAADKEEYLYIETSAALPDQEIGEVKLADFQGSYLAALFYRADFTPGPREEILELMSKQGRFEEVGCKVINDS